MRYVYARYTSSAMPTMQAIARVAAALADPARLAILAALSDGEATVSELAARLGLAQPRVSTHLARLRVAGLVTPIVMGRHHAYRADTVRLKRLLDALYESGSAVLPTPSRRAGHERRLETPLRRARTCYDHLAGVAGVEVLETMLKRGWLVPRSKDGFGYELTPSGARALARRRVDVDGARASRRQFASGCLDWTERQPHLGGALGAALLGALCARGYVRRRRGARDVRIVKPLKAWLAG
jgi:DNA-binding transcriptional ArsR family regulator